MARTVPCPSGGRRFGSSYRLGQSLDDRTGRVRRWPRRPTSGHPDDLRPPSVGTGRDRGRRRSQRKGPETSRASVCDPTAGIRRRLSPGRGEARPSLAVAHRLRRSHGTITRPRLGTPTWSSPGSARVERWLFNASPKPSITRACYYESEGVSIPWPPGRFLA